MNYTKEWINLEELLEHGYEIISNENNIEHIIEDMEVCIDTMHLNQLRQFLQIWNKSKEDFMSETEFYEEMLKDFAFRKSKTNIELNIKFKFKV